jgi:hypothetical protein
MDNEQNKIDKKQEIMTETMDDDQLDFDIV